MNNAPERVDRTHSVELQPGVLRVRSDGKRVYAEDFKAELVRQCLKPGTSVAATAMAHRINANLLRRWIGLQGARSACSQSPGVSAWGRGNVQHQHAAIRQRSSAVTDDSAIVTGDSGLPTNRSR
jgi:transposase-like protein